MNETSITCCHYSEDLTPENSHLFDDNTYYAGCLWEFTVEYEYCGRSIDESFETGMHYMALDRRKNKMPLQNMMYKRHKT